MRTEYAQEAVMRIYRGGVCVKRRREILPAVLLLLSALFPSCGDSENGTVVDCPAEIAARAFRFAELYRDSDTVYEWGGQDPVRSAIAIDCSGLVVMCYKYATVDTKYSLLLSDMSAGYMRENSAAIIELEQMRRGDLIFMGEEDSSDVTHIALFDCMENGSVYFIDSTEKDDISGVSRRSYSKDDGRFKAFGIMRLRYES